MLQILGIVFGFLILERILRFWIAFLFGLSETPKLTDLFLDKNLKDNKITYFYDIVAALSLSSDIEGRVFRVVL